ncbi:hypothetical protein [Alteromonas stellipolaris]|nr:hypothetical protein [Alteromonas stellipolaris]MBZ2164354.1 hypothetical protein [Alteromonas stellipolaris]
MISCSNTGPTIIAEQLTVVEMVPHEGDKISNKQRNNQSEDKVENNDGV